MCGKPDGIGLEMVWSWFEIGLELVWSWIGVGLDLQETPLLQEWRVNG